MNDNKHPSPDNIRRVAAKLESMIPNARNGKLNMCAWNIYNEPAFCGTIACHGGLYELEHALRNGDKYVFNLNKEDDLQRSYLSEKNEEGTMIPLNFKNGADRIARDLGFTSRRELEKWATSNPERWGNKYGGSLFCDENAFNEKETTILLTTIVTWWRNVADRIERLNVLESLKTVPFEPGDSII